jgi:hypothetical protein
MLVRLKLMHSMRNRSEQVAPPDRGDPQLRLERHHEVIGTFVLVFVVIGTIQARN